MTMTEPKTEQKWTTDPNDLPGPRQVSGVNKALNRLKSAGYGKRELHGVRGRPDTHHILHAFMSAEREQVQCAKDSWQSIGEAHGWMVSRSNANAIKKAAEAAAKEADAAIPTIDKLEEPEAYDAKRAEMAERAEKANAERAEREAESAKAHAAILAKRPPRAAALIVAVHHEDQSDIMTDYFAHRTTRTVAIGWRTGRREDFRQLRRAAAAFEPTAHLGPDASDDVEHRENYSMGAGNYLKSGSSHCTGWAVKSIDLTPDGKIPGYVGGPIEDAIPDATPAQTEAPTNGDGYTVREAQNKRGTFWLVVPAVRVDRAAFEELRDSAKASGGWYSRAWRGQPGGFGFPEQETAEEWAAENLGGDNAPTPTDPDSERRSTAEHLEALADKMQADIDHKRAPLSQNWTPRRARIKDGQRTEADHLERVQQGLRALATAHCENQVPPVLANVTTRKAVEEHLRFWYGEDIGALHNGTVSAQGLALRDLIEAHTTDADREAKAQREREARVRELEDSARTHKVPGFFPTPEAVVARMLETAGVDTSPGEDDRPRFNFLEPSAGIGSISEPLRDYVQRYGGGLVSVEINRGLCEILEAKGLASDPGCEVYCGDFTDLPRPFRGPQGEAIEFDRILMNPPFERNNGRQDLRHVVRAAGCLAPDGVLVALVTPATARMLEDEPPARCAVIVSEPLPEGSFTGKEAFRQTGVSVTMVAIQRED